MKLPHYPAKTGLDRVRSRCYTEHTWIDWRGDGRPASCARTAARASTDSAPTTSGARLSVVRRPSRSGRRQHSASRSARNCWRRWGSRRRGGPHRWTGSTPVSTSRRCSRDSACSRMRSTERHAPMTGLHCDRCAREAFDAGDFAAIKPMKLELANAIITEPRRRGAARLIVKGTSGQPKQRRTTPTRTRAWGLRTFEVNRA